MVDWNMTFIGMHLVAAHGQDLMLKLTICHRLDLAHQPDFADS